MHERKYRKFYASKYKHPTRVGHKGSLNVGSTSARREVESRVGRKLDVHHVDSKSGQWVFCELINKGEN